MTNANHGGKCLQHAVQVLTNTFWVSPSQKDFVPAEHTFFPTVYMWINTVDNELENLQSKTIKSHCKLINNIFKYNKGRSDNTLKSINGHCTHLVLLFPDGPHLRNEVSKATHLHRFFHWLHPYKCSRSCFSKTNRPVAKQLWDPKDSPKVGM